MANLAIIPARGGSKRIPRKNIKTFLGKPIIAYSIEAALQSELFDEVMVSTDDEDIAALATSLGAKVPFLRSKKASDDFATTYDVIEEVILKYKDLGMHFNKACCLYATSPLVQTTNLTFAFNLLSQGLFSSVFPVVRYGFPVQRAVKKLENHHMEPLFPTNVEKRSQDLEPIFHDAGQFYVFYVDRLLIEKKLWSDSSGIFEIPETESQDIDNESDWLLAEIKYKLIFGE